MASAGTADATRAGTNFTLRLESPTNLPDGGRQYILKIAPKAQNSSTTLDITEDWTVSAKTLSGQTMFISGVFRPVQEFKTETAAPVGIYAVGSSSFGSLSYGYSQPAAKTIFVINVSESVVTLTKPTSANYTIGNLSTTSLAAGATATFTITPKTGLGVGSRNETITVYGNSGAVSDDFVAQFTVNHTYTIGASTIPSFGSLNAGYAAPAAKTVTITNTGTGTVTLAQPASTNYTIGTLSTTNLTAGATATFTITPKTGLAAGARNETITINGSNGAKATVNAQFTVVPLTYTISASTIPSFGSLNAGYAAPAAKTVTITNTGTGTVTLAQPTSTNYTIGNLSTTNLTAGATATFTVTPKTGLSAGSKNETITINGSNGAQATVSAQFTVVALTYKISATSSLDFGTLTYPYTQPAAKTVTITNTGTGSVTLTKPSAGNYTISNPTPATIAAGATATFTVRPNAGLAAGTYNVTLTTTGSGGASAGTSVSFTVKSGGIVEPSTNGAHVLYFAKSGSAYANDGLLRVGRWGTLSEVNAGTSQVSRVDQLALFKYGGVIGMSNPMGSSDTWSSDDVLFNPSTSVTATGSWGNIPSQGNENVGHTLAYLRAGKGDPCRLAGYTASYIQSELNAGRVPDNGKWRLPTNAENQAFVGSASIQVDMSAYYYRGTINEQGVLQTTPTSSSNPTWTASSGATNSNIGLAYFPSSTAATNAYLPAAGLRSYSNGAQNNQGTLGYWWSSQPGSSSGGYGLYFGSSGVYPSYNRNFSDGFAVRCVPR